MKPITILWQSDTALVAASQDTAGAGNLVINGTLAANGSVSLIPLKQARYVSFNSASDNSGVTFTVTGTYFGKVVTSAAVTGPAGAGTPTYTTQLFDTITSITVSGAATAIVVSLGGGRTNWIWYNYQSINGQLSYGVFFVAPADRETVEAHFTGTMMPEENLQLADANGWYFSGFDSGATLTSNTISMPTVNSNVPPLSFYCIMVDNSASTDPEYPAAYFTFIQQGIT